MTVVSDVTKLEPMQMVEMFIWNDNPPFVPRPPPETGNVLRWHPGTTVQRGPIKWQGYTYEPYPIEATGFEMQSTGKLPRPTVRVSNIGGVIGNYIRSIADGLGAQVTRKRTLGKYLDASNFPAGNPYADPNTFFNDEVYYVARKVAENPIFVELELAVKFDVEGIMLPRRQVIAGTCQWIYRHQPCPYPATGKKITNDPIYPGLDAAGNDRCGKTLTSCGLRFNKYDAAGKLISLAPYLPTSAFPASMLARYV